MDDLISRQAALDAFGLSEQTRKYGGDHSGYDTRMLYEIQETLENLPSAQPEQKWIPCKTGILPEERDKFYQATYLLDNGDRIVDYVYFNSKGTWSNYAYEYSELLAWMPLPDPYREDGGE